MLLHDYFIQAIETFPNFVIVDSQSNIVYLNKSYSHLLGVTPEAAQGKPVTEVIPGTRLPEIVRNKKPELGSVMVLYHHELKKNVTVVCSRLPLVRDGECIGAIGMTNFENQSELDPLFKEIERVRYENEKIKAEIDILKKTQNPLEKIIGISPATMEIKRTIDAFAKSNLSVLITGETGVGKEVFASAIHELSNRKMEPFIKINCASIPSELLESELFGYEEGAFTGAKKQGKPGKFELADGGTLLLDEIGEMPMYLQPKILRALQEHEIERVGSTKATKINVRTICCTNQNLLEQIERKQFRADLYYRINTVEIEIPALRNRFEDLPGLCDYFIDRTNKSAHLHTLGISPSVIELFKEYSWPGNVRELEHIMERLCFMNPNSIISLKQCDFFIKRIKEFEQEQNRGSEKSHTNSTDKSLHYNRDQSEIESIIYALNQANGNKSKAAKILDIDRSTLYYKIKKYHLLD